MDIGQLFRVLLSRAKLIVGMALAAAALAAAFLVLFPAKYTATAIVLLDPREPRVTESKEVLPGIGSDVAAVESQIELVKSPILARKVIAKLGLQSDPEFNASSIIGDLKKEFGLERVLTPEQRETALVGKFEKSLNVSRRGLTYVLEINYTATDPDKAAQIANAVANAYIQGQQDLKSELAKGASQWLDEQIVTMRERVRASEQAVADFKAKNDIVDVTQGNQLIQRRMEDLSQQLAMAQARNAEFSARLKEVQSAAKGRNAAEALSEILKSDTMTGLRDQYANAARLEAQYRAIYGTQHPFLQASREQLAELQHQIDQEVARVLQGLRTEQKAASKQETALNAELNKLKSDSEKLRQASVPLGALTREAEADRALLTRYLGRVKETREEQSLRFENARVISPALPPLKPSRPGNLILIMAAAIAGGCCGIALALVLEQQRRGLISAGEVEQVLGLPYLGTLPDLKVSRSHFNPLAWFGANRGARADARAQAEYTRIISAIARRLRRSAPKNGEIIVVASALAGEGKSTFAANLARASAACGVRTLLVDGDGYSGQITRMFSIVGPGLQELIEGHGQTRGATTADISSGLYVMGTGDMKGAEFHHLDERMVAEVLQDFQQSFDVIVIDSPPILPTGGRMIECADRIVMIVEWGRTDRADVIDALNILGPLETNVAGIVLNNAPFEGRPTTVADRSYASDVYAAGSAPLYLPRQS